MSRGKINLQANDGAVIGLVVPDGLASGERQIALGANLSGATAYHLLQGNLAVSNSTITQGFNTTLYTGNGNTQSINTGIDMSTQWGNDTSETFGGLVWGKSRSGTTSNALTDTIRGANNTLFTNITDANSNYVGRLTSFNNNGFSLGSDIQYNTNLATYASWNFQTTHRVSGTTNHGKAYTCHYNPFTGFTIIKYEGSGIAGHEIPHHLGRKLGFYTCKQLDGTYNWVSQYRDLYYLYLNTTTAETASSIVSVFNETNMSNGIASETNGNNLTYIMYGWANSYFDESNKLIGNYEIGVYQGTGVSGNKVTTRGKPAWVMIKRLDSTGNWQIFDNLRHPSNYAWILANSSQIEYSDQSLLGSILSDGFTLGSTNPDVNTSGGQYLYMAVYDNDSGSGKSKYYKATDNANVQINNAVIPLAKGIDSNGVKNEIVIANETITGVTWEEGKNYPYKTDSGYGKSTIAPTYDTTNPLTGDFFNILENKWYDNTNTEITESRNYMNHIVYADSTGNPLYVEELPKIEYKDVIKANEYQGKNAISLSCAFNPSTTPITIIGDLIGVNSIVKVSSGVSDIYLSSGIDGSKLKFSTATSQNEVSISAISENKLRVTTYTSGGTAANANYISINGVGE